MKHFYSLKLILFAVLVFSIHTANGQCGVHPKIATKLNNGTQAIYSGTSTSVDQNWYIYKYQWFSNGEVSVSENTNKINDWNPKLPNSVNKISLKVWVTNILTGDSCFDEASGLFQSTGEPFYPIVNNSNSQQSELNSRTVYGIDAAKIIGDAEFVRTNILRNTISFVMLRTNVKVSEERSVNWLNINVLRGENGMEMRFYRKDSDKIGFKHLRFKQYYKGIPVEHSMYIVHAKEGFILSANGEAYAKISVNTKASIAPEMAKQKAYKAFPASRYISEENDGHPELFILPLKDGVYSLVYKVDVNTEEPLSRQWVYVNAQNGDIVKTLNRLETYNVTATADTRYSGLKPIITDSISASNYRLSETGRGAGTSIETYNLNHGSNYSTATTFTNSSKTWAYAYDNAALDAHFGAEKTYDHYFNTYGFNSIDNAGLTIKSYVHYSTNYINAFWNGSVMTYGDGNGSSYNPLTSLEIVGHEITHGVTEHSAALIYSGESGALNESFSDVMGNTIRFKSNPSATWLCGDQIVVPGSSATPFRNLANPNDYQCADTYGGQYFNNGDIVHYDSGIQNFWYYLLTQGGVGVNDIGNSYTVIGIGLDKANAIAFRNLTVYLTPSSTFADARAGAIQSAIDLYGSCSDEVIQTTNAWYAVGVGGLFNNAVVASFNVSNNFFCSIPANISFANTSLNATSFHWDFGDGSTSTLQSPTHTYSAAGNYTVTLIASGLASCGNADTMIVPSCINISNGGGPITISCIPAANITCCGYGIMNVHLETINKNSNNATEGYKDFSCSDQTSLVAGNTYPISITTSSSNSENVSVWIDYNNDGIFTSTEKVFSSLKMKSIHSGYLNTSISAVLNTALRMRVIDDDTSYNISGPCNSPVYGQVEDYTVTFVENTLPPIADFSVSKQSLNIGDQASFYDLTANAPTGWLWSFPGGIPSTSTLRNPVIQYSSLGVYPVTLHVLNSFGSDSITKISYITVVNFFNMCTKFSTNATNGTLYDSGGPSGVYLDGENCSFLISPACADTIVLTINSFQTESTYDYLKIYDGTSNLSPLLFSASGGTTIQKVKAPSGKMFIQFISDGSITYSGFDLSWSTIFNSFGSPTAQFSIDDITPPVNVPVQFNDLSTNTPNSWLWTFGDGDISTLQNPKHTYTVPGTYSVGLIATTCTASDTATLQITVQDYPIVSSNPDSVSITVSCGDSIRIPVMVYNTGTGDLVINGNSVNPNNSNHKRILVCTNGVDMAGEYINTIAGINSGFTDYSITQFNGVDSAQLSAALDTSDVLLFPEKETSLGASYSMFKPVVQRFVNRGGNVIVCTDYEQRLTAMGLLNSSSVAVTTNIISVLDTTHFIMDSVPPDFTSSNLTLYCVFTDLDRTTLAYSSLFSHEVVTYREIGQGSVTYIGFDFYTSNTPFARVISNAIKGETKTSNNLIEIDPNAATIAPGDSELIYIVINSNNLYSGQYDFTATLISNDPTNLEYSIPCHVNLVGDPFLSLSDTCLQFSEVFNNEESIDSVEISNNGCDTLFISSITSSSSEFTPVASGPIVVPPYSNYTLNVQFMSTTIGSFSGQLTVLNNDQDTSICLVGTAVGSPLAIVNPDTMFVTVNCTDSITRYLSLSNNGLSNLEYEVQSSTRVPDSLNILVCTYGVDMTQEYLHMISALDSRHMKYKLTFFNGTDAAGLTSELIGKNVLLFPEQETGSNTHYLSWVAPISTFLANGGRVVVVGAQNSDRITNMGLINGTYEGYTANVVLNTLDTTHFVTDSIAQNINATNLTCYHTFTDVDCVHLVKYSIYDVVAYKKIGNGDVVFLGFDYYESSPFADRLLINSIFGGFNIGDDWLSVNESSGSLSPGDSVLIPVMITTNSQSTGTDTSSIVINTNDPLHPQIIVPIYLEIFGSPNIIFSDTCINFGSVPSSSSKTDTLHLLNSGCDSLNISSILMSNPGFTYSLIGSGIIPHDGTLDIIINVSTPDTGWYNGTLTIQSNIADTSICLSAYSYAVPKIEQFTDTIFVHSPACSNSITIPITVYNVGEDTLVYHSNIYSSIAPPLKIVALTYGVNLSYQYQNTLAAINQNFTNYTLATVSTPSALSLSNALVNADVLLIPAPENGYATNFIPLASVIQNFVASGKVVIYCGADNAHFACILNTGIITGSNGPEGYNSSLTVLNAASPFTAGVPQTFIGVNATHVKSITNTSKVMLISFSNQDVFSYVNYGMGKAFYLAFDYFMYSNVEARLIGNILSQIVQFPPSTWATTPSGSQTVLSGDSSVINIVLNPDSASLGVNSSTLLIQSNDPSHPIDSVVIVMLKDLDGCASINMTVDSCGHSIFFDADIVTPNTLYYWSFGDGFISTIKSPHHYYTNKGTYIVRLIVSQNGFKDTTFATVNVGFNNAPLSPSCTPSTLSYCCDYGILGVQLQSINKLSNDGSDGYQDYSCTDSTTLNRGQNYNLMVLTDSTVASNVSAWIDYDNDGVFSLSEQLFTLSAVSGLNSGNFTIPVNAIPNTPLRMRVGSDNSSSSLMDPCLDLTNGQYEDYTVWLRNVTGLNENSEIAAAILLPNPFSNETTLSYELIKPTSLSVKVFDALGRLVNTVVDNEEQSSGIHNVRISPEVSGVYFVRLVGGGFSEVFRIVKTK